MRKAILCSTLLLAAACGEDTPPALTVGPVAYSQDELLGLSPARRQALGELTAFGLAVADSTYMELGAPLLKKARNDRLLEILAAELTLEKNGVSEDVLEARYLTDPEYELTVRHILFFSERWRTADHRAAAEAKAERALEALRAGADFAETAARLSEEPGAEGRQGLLTPGREGAWVDEFWAAASALAVGEISPVTETQYGYHILRLEDREIVPFQEARSRVALDVADRIEDPRAVLADFLDRQPEIFLAEDVVEASTYDRLADDALLATWDGGRLTFADYRAWAAAQPADWEEGGLGSDRDRFRSSVAQLARRHQALAEAESRGLSLSEGDAAAIRREWSDKVAGWAATLGFAQGAAADQVKTAALAALAATGQGAAIARQELAAHAPLLRASHTISVAPM